MPTKFKKNYVTDAKSSKGDFSLEDVVKAAFDVIRRNGYRIPRNYSCNMTKKILSITIGLQDKFSVDSRFVLALQREYKRLTKNSILIKYTGVDYDRKHITISFMLF